jgi:histone H2A
MTDNSDPIDQILNDENKENHFELFFKSTTINVAKERPILRSFLTEVDNFSEFGSLIDQSDLINTIKDSNILNTPSYQESSQIVINQQSEPVIIQDTLIREDVDSRIQADQIQNGPIQTGQIQEDKQQEKNEENQRQDEQSIELEKDQDETQNNEQNNSTEGVENIARSKSTYEKRVENLKKAKEIRKNKKLQKQNQGNQLARYKNDYSQKFKQSQSKRAGLIFSVNKFKKSIKKSYNNVRLGPGASVYLTAVLEYLTAELLDLSGDVCFNFKKNRITPRFIMMAVKQDIELNELLKGVTISESGVLPIVNKVITLKPEERKKLRTRDFEKMTDDFIFITQSGGIKKVNNGEQQQQQKQQNEQPRQTESNGTNRREQERNEQTGGGNGDMNAGDGARDRDNDDNNDKNKKTSKNDNTNSNEPKETEAETETESERDVQETTKLSDYNQHGQQQDPTENGSPKKKRGRGRPKKDEQQARGSKSRSRSRSKCIILIYFNSYKRKHLIIIFKLDGPSAEEQALKQKRLQEGRSKGGRRSAEVRRARSKGKNISKLINNFKAK